ncbi:zinc finger, PHD-type [Artemisia annua]|uniref:Zinc finger, PHD-type n=1 Tax=Artemisia annua TaxID=35608 RepID=A0A2U1N6N9_ARTAN|nr:zinc finger, PHD-type [Artemisia annua]
MEEFEFHEHPLILVDLELVYEEKQDAFEDEHGDDADNLDIEEEFRCRCDRCDEEINEHHRYYYKCSSDSCDYSIHKYCAEELPPTLYHPSHELHILTLLQRKFGWNCDICRKPHEPEERRYRCNLCDFDIDLDCALTRRFYHPRHKHPLVLISKPILCYCDMCGKKHEGTFYRCNTCVDFFIHSDCVALPRKLFIQDYYTDGAFSHTHPLTLSYSFPEADQWAASHPSCRVCGNNFWKQDTLSIYKCEKCWFYTHLDCATSRKEPFMGILTSPGLGKLQKNYKDSDHPDLLHLPFTDETHSILKHKFFRTTGSESFGVNEGKLLKHMSHQHPLTLVDTKCNDITLSCHNPMKKIELLCNGCLRPITSMPFYKCSMEDESCNFALHEWCTRLPDQVQNHPGHSQHPLVLLPKAPYDFGLFKCDVCKLNCNGFVYSCVDCEYDVDASCAFIPEEITHQAHPNHLLKRVQSKPNIKSCRSCLCGFYRDEFSFSCDSCDFDLHPGCALLLQQTIRHKFDKHPMKLSYFPIENHKNKYFCEICEKVFDPKEWFYHCNECVQSMHTCCTPFLLKCEGARYLSSHHSLYQHVNIKFGGIHKIESHPHPLSFVHGTPNDGNCTVCLDELSYEMIFKCLECEFAIHFDCCKIKFGSIYNIKSHPHPLSFVQGTPNDGRCRECWRGLSYKMIFKCLECEFAIHVKCCKNFSPVE